MLYFPNTRIMDSVERAITAGQTVDVEGCALVAVLSGGVVGVQKGSVTATDKFAGVSMAAAINPSLYAYVEDVTVGVGATHTLTNVPSGAFLVYNQTGSAALTQVGGAPNAGEVKVAGAVLTFNAAQVASVVRISYKYAPTMQQIRSIQGDEPAGRAATFTMGSVGVATRGDIMTSEFDAAVNWNVANPIIALGASGLFTIGGTGAVVTGYVTSVPTPESPYLGLHFSA